MFVKRPPNASITFTYWNFDPCGAAWLAEDEGSEATWAGSRDDNPVQPFPLCDRDCNTPTRLDAKFGNGVLATNMIDCSYVGFCSAFSCCIFQMEHRPRAALLLEEKYVGKCN